MFSCSLIACEIENSIFAFNPYEVARKGIMEGQIQGTLW